MNENHVFLEKLLDASDGSVYKLAILVAKRALSLADGDKPLIMDVKEKVLDTALKEIAEGKIRVKRA
ncbi:MAG: DNA-directed RNA polymerase subunit omega [Candidatus Omnitrophica bacterium]|nr:DNA-directed RNA polymerase subunit omega [Candidatus Omnitrophota bacterium]MBU0879148.1 DNA-directed RNA polymerase subunit omega [Candidatus Omnitrophota bacterium]MBU0896669.1 DNA-directed RNA polymerase subunit omega [Candidatus Omnitrophota bacterium]MBU1810030.1 DNA-directed RNA polymerase subunit omega [Candidatus Omnitrophota bacterium]